MGPLRIIDLHFGDRDGAIGVYVVETDDGLALFDCGPSSTLPALEHGLAELGLALTDVRNLLLSHIHLDHAGAAGTIVARHPALTVWVSPVGATHHVSYLREGTLLAGDACGVRMAPSAYVLPVCPPPDLDVGAWHATAAEIRRRAPERLALIHFGVFDDVATHLDRFETELDRWLGRAARGLTVEEFSAAARADMGEHADQFDRVAPLWQSYAGLERYLTKTS